MIHKIPDMQISRHYKFIEKVAYNKVMQNRDEESS